MKILYLMDTLAHLSTVIVHRLVYHETEACTLVANKSIVEKRGLSNTLYNLGENGIFSDVKLIDTMCSANLAISEERYESYIEDFYATEFANADIELNLFDRIYVGVDTWCSFVNIYFNLINRPYYYIQTLQIKDFPLVYENPGWHPSKEFLAVANKHKMWSYEAKMAIPVFWVDRTDKSCFNKPYDEWLGLSAVSEISDEMLNAVARVYETERHLVSDVLYLPNSYGLSRIVMRMTHYQKISYSEKVYRTEEVFAGVLETALDYFIPNTATIDIKSHPNDPLYEEDCRNVYGDGYATIPIIPMELLGEYLRRKELKYKYMLAAFSTSANAVPDSIVDRKIILGRSYVRLWQSYDALYALIIIGALLDRKLVADTDDVAEQLQFIQDNTIIENDFLDYYRLHGRELPEVCEYANKGNLENVVYCVNAITLMYRGIKLVDFLRFGCRGKTIAIYNLVEAGYFIPDEYEDAFSIISLTKEIYGKREFPVGNDTHIFIYDTDKNIHKKLRSLNIGTDMPRRGFRLCISYEGSKQLEYIFLSKINMLSAVTKALTDTTEQINERLSLSLATLVDANAGYTLSTAKSLDFISFADICMFRKQNTVIIASVRDTPGDCLSKSEIKAMQLLGFGSISKELWKMYIGIVCQGKVISDNVAEHSEENIESKFYLAEYDLNLSVTSKAWRTGDQSEIVINGIDYSPNIRGINIVVWNIVDNRVEDAIGYDHHYPDGRFIRKLPKI